MNYMNVDYSTKIPNNVNLSEDRQVLKAFRPHVAPPIHVTGMPALQRLEHLPILGEIHVVGNLGGVVDVHDVHGLGLPFWAIWYCE